MKKRLKYAWQDYKINDDILSEFKFQLKRKEVSKLHE
jgi:hypothetical protein